MYPFFSPIPWYPIVLVATILSHRYNSRMAQERRRLKVMRPPIHNPTKPHCFLTQRASNPEASRTNVSEETPCTWQPWLACTAPGPPQESLVRDETRISLPAKPPRILDDARPIVRCPTDLPVAACCDRAWGTNPGSLVTQLTLQYREMPFLTSIYNFRPKTNSVK